MTEATPPEKRYLTIVLHCTHEGAKALGWKLFEEIVPGAEIVAIAAGNLVGEPSEGPHYREAAP